MENMEGSCRFDQSQGLQKLIATRAIDVELQLGVLKFCAWLGFRATLTQKIRMVIFCT